MSKDKKVLRESMKILRDSIKTGEKIAKDKDIYEKVINSTYYKEARVIMVYVSMGSEVDTLSIITHALGNNKVICVPKVINLREGMKAIEIHNLQELKKCGKYNILEPEDFDNEIKAESVDLFLVPGLAFDSSGGRIGYGAGFYDRFLKDSRRDALKLGLSYDFQLIKEVPMEDSDIRLDHIIYCRCTE